LHDSIISAHTRVHPREIWLSRGFMRLAGLIAASQALAGSCTDEARADDAQMYVGQCLEVSTATHPPCNADNPCQVIWDEVARGCQMLGDEAPDYCSDY
jgi:hypothetical protein